jgi:dolichyl-phosphate-mannose-protein mannosyltransferase
VKKFQFSEKALIYSIAGAILLVSIFLRFYHLGIIKEKIFDEVYFPVFAQDYITHTDFFDAHPPLGKLIIAVGIKLFGNIPFGWRVMDAVAGMLLLGSIFGFAFDLTKKPRVALLALLFVAIEPMALVESRVGLINIYLAFFSILGLWFFWRWWQSEQKSTADFTLAIVFMAAATSVKWIGIGAFGSSILFLLIQRIIYKQRLFPNRTQLIALIIFPILYLATFIPDIQRGQNLSWWHSNAYNYHAHLKATHPYGSAWWTWAIMIRPIWLYYQSPIPHRVVGIIEIGNVVTWIAGLFALLPIAFKLTEAKTVAIRDRYLFLLLTYLALYLPWIVISRVKFIYHYFIPALILLIMLAIILDEDVLSNKQWRWVGILLIIAAIAFFIYFIPLLIGYPISDTFYQQHMWLKSWI